jgi:hypothetical protein
VGSARRRARRQGDPHRRARHPGVEHPQEARRVRQHLVDRGLRLGGRAAGRARLGQPRAPLPARRRPPRLRRRRGDLSQPARRLDPGAQLDAARGRAARLADHPRRGHFDLGLLHGAARTGSCRTRSG